MTWIECRYEGQRWRVVLGARPVTVGRAKTSDLPFPDDKEVSRNHAQFEKRGDFFYVVDLKSTNGTLVNGQRVTVPHPIKDGDLVEIGSQRLYLRTLDAAALDAGSNPYRGYPHYYVIMKVPQDAPQEVIENHYTVLSRIYDPELHPETPLVEVLQRELDEAYSVLGDPSRRTAYDQQLEG